MSDDDDGVDWQRRLRDLRGLLGWSQRRLAKELRVTSGAVSQWESRQRPVPGPVQRLIEIYEQELGMLEPPARGQPKVNGSWAQRTLRSTSTVARLAATAAGVSIRNLVAGNLRSDEIRRATQAALADELGRSFGELKGFMLKVGQTLSYLEFAAPPIVREHLQHLQDRSVALPPAVVHEVLERELGAPAASRFRSFDPAPFAAASIGQVHRAVLKSGEAVAVKVQYPNVRAALAADLRNVATMQRAVSSIFASAWHEELLHELRERFLDECDYVREGRDQEIFRERWAGVPDVVVPRVFEEHTTERVLTTELVDGARFATFVRSADQAARDRAGQIIFRFALEGAFRHRMFNADPHPGNYLFLADGRVAFLDFGCVKRFDADIIHRWRSYACAVVDDDRPRADRLLRQLGAVADADRFDFDYQHKMMRQLYEPFLEGGLAFRFNPHFVVRNWRAMVVENPNRTRLRVPKDLLFLNRLHWGLHSVLAELQAAGDWRAVFDTCVRVAR